MALFLPYLYYVYCLLYFLGKDIRFLLNTSDTVILSSSGRLATGLLCVLVLQKTLFFCTELPWNVYHEELFNSVNSVFCWDDHVTLEWKQLDCMHRLHMLANFWKYFVEDFRSCCMIGLSCFPHHSPFPPLSFPPTNLAPQQAPPPTFTSSFCVWLTCFGFAYSFLPECGRRVMCGTKFNVSVVCH